MSTTPDIASIALHLKCSVSKISLEVWKYVYFVKVERRRPTFVSKRKFSIVEEKPITRFHGSDYLNQYQTMAFRSSCLASGTYCKDTNTLSLTFKHGLEYNYYNVPYIVWRELTKSYVSPGKAFNQLIKGKYRGCKVA